jgi:hypothetical protein
VLIGAAPRTCQTTWILGDIHTAPDAISKFASCSPLIPSQAMERGALMVAQSGRTTNSHGGYIQGITTSMERRAHGVDFVVLFSDFPFFPFVLTSIRSDPNRTRQHAVNSVHGLNPRLLLGFCLRKKCDFHLVETPHIAVLGVS